MLLQRIGAFFMAVVAFFNILFSGYVRYMPHNRIFLNQFYTDSKNERQTYDLVIPKNASGSAGLVLCIHGGAWVGGSKDSYTKNLMEMSEEHYYAAAAVNYRYLSETVGFDEILDDISSALAAIRAKGSEYGVDFDRVLLTGASAGGHLSLLYAYTRKDTAPIKPVCVVELCGPTDLEHEFYYAEENAIAQAAGVETLYTIIGQGVKQPLSPDTFDAARPALKQYSPINFVDEATVPTVFGHGEQDEIVPYRNALDLDAKLTACGVEHSFVSFPDSGHACEDKVSMARVMSLFFEYASLYLD